MPARETTGTETYLSMMLGMLSRHAPGKMARGPSEGGVGVQVVMKYILFAVMGVFLVGCGTTTKEIIRKSHSERTDVFSEVNEEKTPHEGFVDLMMKVSIKTHLEGYYLLESRNSLHGKPGYPFVFNIDGQGALWKEDGREETSPLYDERGGRNPEGGKGVKYTLEKIVRLKAGPHMVFFGLPEENYSVKFSIALKEGGQHVLDLKPVYVRRRTLSSGFVYGISRYEIFLNGIPVQVSE